MFICPKCGQEKEQDPVDSHMCVDCAKAENTRITYYRQHQGDWLAEAKEQGLDAWLQQPGETQWEYTVWCSYRDSYPGKKPSYGQVAVDLGTTYNVVKKIAQRWSFNARMQVWMAEVDRITMLQRKDEILNMNKKHIDMATKINQKLESAIDRIQPEGLSPSEIVSLAKLSTDLERKARVDTEAQDAMRRELLVDNTNPELKKNQAKQSDLTEIMQILIKAGALQSVTTLGVKETTTREIVAKDDSGHEASITQEGDDNSVGTS